MRIDAKCKVQRECKARPMSLSMRCTRGAEKHSGSTATARYVQLHEGARYGTIFFFKGPTWASDIEVTPRSDCKLGTLQIEGVKEQTADIEQYY